MTNQDMQFAQTVSPLAATAHASLADSNVETVNIPSPPKVPSDMISLQMYDAGTTSYMVTRLSQTIRCGAK